MDSESFEFSLHHQAYRRRGEAPRYPRTREGFARSTPQSAPGVYADLHWSRVNPGPHGALDISGGPTLRGETASPGVHATPDKPLAANRKQDREPLRSWQARLASATAHPGCIAMYLPHHNGGQALPRPDPG